MNLVGYTMFALVLGRLSTPEAVCPRDGSLESHVVLTWIDPEQLVAETEELERDVKSLFGAIGIPVEWRTYSGRHAPDADQLEVHVHLRGHEPSRWKLSSEAMGVTFQDHRRAERVYVFFPAIARALGRDPRELKNRSRNEPLPQMSRALSRVVAHEVFHALASHVRHGTTGLTRHRLTRKDLLSDTSTFDARSAMELRRRLCEPGSPAEAESNP